MLRVPLNMGMSAAHCQGNVREFQSVWRVVALKIMIRRSLQTSFFQSSLQHRSDVNKCSGADCDSGCFGDALVVVSIAVVVVRILVVVVVVVAVALNPCACFVVSHTIVPAAVQLALL